ncbi:MAG: MFS transporter, partial [Verrucomicrobiota bacterium]
EIFPLQIKGFGMGLATSIQWLANFLNVAFFLSAIEKFHPSFVFIIYSCLCFLTYLFSKHFVPETKNLSLEDINCEATELI